MNFFSDDDGGYIGFGGNASGTLNPRKRNESGFTQARIKGRYMRFQVPAPALAWGTWVEVFSQFGVTGPNADQHITRVNLSLSSDSAGPSSFDYEIKGGDYSIRGVAGGSGASETVNITGNVATALSVRAKSHSSIQKIIVTVN